MKRKLLFMMILIFSLGIQACKAKDPAPASDKKPKFRHDGNLSISAPDGSLKAEFIIEIAASENEHITGLKFRESMQANQAMLFPFEHIDYHSFWMQDTYLSLDMIFVDQYDQIVYIEENTTPFSEEVVFPDTPCQYVLEVLAGSVAKYDLKVKDIVKWERIKD